MPLRSGDVVSTPTIVVEEPLRAELVRLGGYTHPLFSPAASSSAEQRPLPGQALLLLMGGLVEQTGRFDDAVALVGFSDVRFRRPAVVGTSVRVRIEVLGETPHHSGQVVRAMRWTAIDATDRVLATAEVRLLVRPG